MYQRTVHEWEKRQRQLQMDYGELMSRVEYLSDEVGWLVSREAWRFAHFVLYLCSDYP
jgi:hypothetical protein